MRMSGEARVAAPPIVVWESLTDAGLLGRLIPGCESMTGDPARGYEVVVERKVAGLTARLGGRFDLSEVAPGRGCRVRGEGQGGAAGLAQGEALVRLIPEGEATRVDYEVEARLGGRLAAVPNMIVRAVAGRMIDAFFDRFRAAVEGGPPDPGSERRGWFGRPRG